MPSCYSINKVGRVHLKLTFEIKKSAQPPAPLGPRKKRGSGEPER